MQAVDFKDRKLIIDELKKNMLVMASAGSGKTTMLVNRMVALIESGDAKISELCAITFTKAAAKEFYERLYIKLLQRSKGEKDDSKLMEDPTDITKERCLEAVNDFDKCFLGTIDSFCLDLIKQYPRLANVPSSVHVCDDNEFSIIVKQKYNSILKHISDYISKEDFECLNSLYDKRLNDTIVDMIINLFDRLEYDLIIKNSLYNYKEYLNWILEIKGLVDFIKKNQSYILSRNRETTEILDTNINIDWYRNLDKVSRICKNLEKCSLSKDIGIVINPGYMKYLAVGTYNRHDAYIFNGTALDYLKQIKYVKTMEFIELVKNKIVNELYLEGNLNFHMVLMKVEEMLRNNIKDNSGSLIDLYRSKYKFYFLDESQDTDPLQTKIFFYLTSSNKKVEWDKNIPVPGSLFIVGDPKQSIYKFKGADVSNFIHVKELFDKDPKNSLNVNLVCNFRSTDTLINYFNTVFDRLFKYESSSYQIPEEQIKHPKIPLNSRSETGIYTGIYKINFDAKNYIQDIGKYIKSIVHNDKYQIYDKDLKEIRSLKYKDIMIIDEATTGLGKYEETLGEMDIPVFINGSVSFDKSKILICTINIFKYLVNKDINGMVNAINILYPSIKQSELAELVNLIKTRYDKKISIPEKYNDFIERLNSVNSINLSYSQLFIEIIKKFELIIHINLNGLDYVYYTYELLKKSEIDGSIKNSTEAVEYLEKLLKNIAIEKRLLLVGDYGKKDEDYTSVQIANLHKVKGLEAPVVILSKKSSKVRTASFYYDKTKNKGYVIKIEKENIPILSTTQFPEEEGFENESLSYEKKRLDYVAATRARNVLVVMQDNDKNNWGHLASEFTGNIDITSLSNEEAEKEPIKLVTISTIQSDESKNKKTYEILTPSEEEKHNKEDSESIVVIGEAGVDKSNLRGDYFGNIVHDMMRKIIESKNKILKENLFKSVLKNYNDIDKNLYTIELEKVYKNVQNHGYGDIISVLKYEDVYCEIPFSFKEDDKICYGIIDLLYRDEFNKWHIIDYKTDSGKTMNELIAQYSSQQNLYKEAIKVIMNIDADWKLLNIN